MTTIHRGIFRALLMLVVVILHCRGLHAREAQFEFVIRNDVMVSMRDGIKLATDVYLPVASTVAQRYPIILTRTPYNKDGSKAAGQYFASRGYVFVAQDTRGRFRSDGVWHFLTDDGRDGVDTAKWIEEQPWSNGKIGMMGTSYVGGTQHAMALEKTPQLATVIAVDAVSNMGYQGMRNAGAFELRFWNWILAIGAPSGSRQVRDPGTAAVLRQMMDDRRSYLQHLPLRRGTTPLQFAPEYEDWLVEAMGHGANDDFWKQNNVLDRPTQYKDMPVYLVGGWYDSWAGNTTANYQALAQAIRGPVYLIMGPWIHGSQGSAAHGQVSFGKDAAIADELGWRLAWYDHWLKGIDDAFVNQPHFATPVRIFVMGTGDGRRTKKGLLNHGGYWRDEREWPLARSRPASYYFQANGLLSTVPPQAEGGSTSFTFDPQNPVPTLGGNISSGDGIMQQGAWNQRGGTNFWNAPDPVPLSARNDILVFQTTPLAAEVEVTGEISIRFWASSSAVDTDFTAKLIDVYPSNPDCPGGFDLNLEDGIVRARFRDSLTEEKLMTPGTVYPFTIKLYPTSNVFKKGHRIRVDVSSSNFPRFDVNPNTGEPLNDQRRSVRAVNTVYHERAHPSCIVLPIVLISDRATVQASAVQAPAMLDLTRDQILDRIRGGWTGMLIGGIEGLAHEFKYIQEPRKDLPDYPMLPNGARTDDDNDFEWTHLYFMDKENVIQIPYPRLVEIWKANMNTGLWCANLQARKLMDEGIVPPETANPARNSFAPFNLAGQFCVESYGMIAPGMPQTAAEIGLHYARVSVSGEPLQATRYWTTLVSLAAVSHEPIESLITRSLAAVDPNSAQAEAVHQALRLFHESTDWKAARQFFHRKWYFPKEWTWDPEARPQKWNDNSTPLNGAMVILALLYGNGDFYKTGQYAMALGYDADCNAATACAVVGTWIGFAEIEKFPQFHMPDRYLNLTRPQLPRECPVSEQAATMMRICEKLILANGGQQLQVQGQAGFRIQLQVPSAF